uniref:IPT/TIG domain-containing protein n=1 Tax=Xiphophorus couchianus TaxID=32473 RepID=A0A3B5MCM1_9TELE
MSLSVSVHQGKSFTYYQNPQFFPLNRDAPDAPYRFKPGGVIAVEGLDLTRAMSKDEVRARLGDQDCEVKTLDRTHLYCEPPENQTLNDSHLLREDIDYSAMVTIATGLPPTLEPGSVSPVCLTCSSDSERPGEERSRGSAVSH